MSPPPRANSFRAQSATPGEKTNSRAWRIIARHTRTARLAVTWAAATVALMLMLMGAAGGVLYEAQTALQERGNRVSSFPRLKQRGTPRSHLEIEGAEASGCDARSLSTGWFIRA